MDETDVSPTELCREILTALFSSFSQHLNEKEKSILNEQTFDLAVTFGTVQNPLFQDYLTYLSVLSQHARTEVIQNLISLFAPIQLFIILFRCFLSIHINH